MREDLRESVAMTARRWLEAAAARLTAAGSPEGPVEARWMLADALGGITALTLALDRPLEEPALSKAQGWLEERLTGMPLQYAQGRAWFMGHAFGADRRALIPRQDTELLCEQGICRAGQGPAAVLDLCTGSGALAISLKLACPQARVWASDLSKEALALAQENARRLGADVAFLHGDLLAPAAGLRFDVILCNPPYLSGADMAALQPEVRFEPAMALYGGADGLDFYRRLAVEAPGALKPGGWLLLEVGAGQAPQVADLLGGGCALYRDLPGIERVVEKRY